MIEAQEQNGFIREIINLNARAFSEYEVIGREKNIKAEDVLLLGKYTREIAQNETLISIAKKAKEVLEIVGWFPALGVKGDDVYQILLLLNDLVGTYDDSVDRVDAEIQELLLNHNLQGLVSVFQREGIPFENTEDGIIEAARKKNRPWELEWKRKAFDP
jgi:hypothetical protein